MNMTIQRIKKTSKAVLIGLSILAAMLLFTIILSIVELAGYDVKGAVYDTGANVFATRVLLLAVLLKAAHIFYKINKAGTPFLTDVAKSLKTTALLVALLIAVPKWVYQIVTVDKGLTLLNSSTFFALLCGGIVFCFAAVFEYGCLLQVENDETL
ncbi:hypothetical protein LJC42_04710 [Eubacteriales bacterium OttesenSCG-928-K08]|nr:hypothetical protein [Eubacteriales bacterium OttesenSCG-928-K08]